MKEAMLNQQTKIKPDFSFITNEIQRGRRKPERFKHWLSLPLNIYIDVTECGLFKPQDYFIDQSAFFEFSEVEVKISFRDLYLIEDLHLKIHHYLLIKSMGCDPVKRGGTFF